MEDTIECGVLVVGLGPSGASALRKAVEQGVSAIGIDKRKKVGWPTKRYGRQKISQCAEGVGKRRFWELVEYALPEECIACEFEELQLISPDGTNINININEDGGGLVLNRMFFDGFLVKQAEKAGARIWSGTKAVGLKLHKNRIEVIVSDKNHCPYSIYCKVLIAADGTNSKIGKLVRIDTELDDSDVMICYQYLLFDSCFVGNKFAKLFFGNEFAPGGYGWAFPKSGSTANVGIGIPLEYMWRSGISPKIYLDKFVKRNFPEARILGKTGGKVPTGLIKNHYLLLDSGRGGIVVVGDAGRFANPLTGGGILNAIETGEIAGNIAAEVVRGEASIEEYESRIAGIVEKIRRYYDYKKAFCGLSDGEMNAMAEGLKIVFKEGIPNIPNLDEMMVCFT